MGYHRQPTLTGKHACARTEPGDLDAGELRPLTESAGAYTADFLPEGWDRLRGERQEYVAAYRTVSEYPGQCISMRPGNARYSAEAGVVDLRGLGLFVSEVHGGQGVAALSRAYEPL